MNKKKVIFDEFKTMRVYGKDHARLMEESKKTGVPLIRIIHNFTISLDKKTERY